MSRGAGEPSASPSRRSTQADTVVVDLSFHRFREDVAAADSRLVADIVRFVEKVELMTWGDVHATSTKGARKRGINWEPLNQYTLSGKRVASVRINAGCRARAVRDGVYMRMISLHPDHDSAYKEPGDEGL